MQLKRQGLFCEGSGITTSCVTKQIQTTDLGVTLSQGKNEKNWLYYFNHFKEALYIDCFLLRLISQNFTSDFLSNLLVQNLVLGGIYFPNAYTRNRSYFSETV